MNCIGATSLTCQASSGDNTIETTVIAGTRKLENILIRRIFMTIGGIWSTGHYWIEIIHDDEDEIDDFMTEARELKLTEEKFISMNRKCTKANGFRESYGWYPDKGRWNGWTNLKGKGFLNADCQLKRGKDKKHNLSPEKDREAGRRNHQKKDMKHDLSSEKEWEGGSGNPQKKDRKSKEKNQHDGKNHLSIRPFDPHQNGRFHEDEIDFTTHPYLLPNDSRTEIQIIEEIRDFASKFEDEWSYKWHGYNETCCHTFVFLLLASCNLADPSCIGAKKDPYFKSYKRKLKNKFDKPDGDKDEKGKKFYQRHRMIEQLHVISKLARAK